MQTSLKIIVPRTPRSSLKKIQPLKCFLTQIMLQCIKCNAEGVLFCIDPTDNKINIKNSKLFDCQVLK